MASCPECASPLRTVRERGGIYLLCGQCAGRAVTFPQIRRCAGDRFVNALLRRIHGGTAPSQRVCPYCGENMRWFQSEDPNLLLHTCRKCDLIWFDAGQFEAVPEGVLHGADQLASKKEDFMTQQVAKRAEREPQIGIADVGWRAAPVVLGFPIEVDRDLNTPKPWLTWVLTGVTVLLSMAAFPNMQKMADRFGFIPHEAWRYGGLTLITPFFLHAGWMHLIGNMYFLVIFGRRVENFLGRWRYSLLLLVATICASLLHFLMQPQSAIPGIGASGGIAGVIAFYAFKFPRVRLGIMFRFRWVAIPAWMALVMWLAYQGLLAEMQVLGIGSVNAFAHMGGALAGILAWVLWRKSQPKPA